jgi:hypothetical protein
MVNREKVTKEILAADSSKKANRKEIHVEFGEEEYGHTVNFINKIAKRILLKFIFDLFSFVSEFSIMKALSE